MTGFHFTGEEREPQAGRWLVTNRLGAFLRGGVPAEGDADDVSGGFFLRINHVADDHPASRLSLARLGGNDQSDRLSSGERALQADTRAPRSQIGHLTLERRAAIEIVDQEITSTRAAATQSVRLLNHLSSPAPKKEDRVGAGLRVAIGTALTPHERVGQGILLVQVSVLALGQCRVDETRS
jgi:hypothetical protein